MRSLERSMNTYDFCFGGAQMMALPSGALWCPDHTLLCVSDLHLGKSERFARRGGTLIPPYEIVETLTRLADDVAVFNPAVVVALGDSFDDDEAVQALSAETLNWVQRLQAGRQWIWIAGNHDPAPLELGGAHRNEFQIGQLIFRHIASDLPSQPEISGHYHPKARVAARGRSISRPCFLVDQIRLILPAYGTYTGGLRSTDRALCKLMSENAQAILTGPVPAAVPMPRGPVE